MNTVDILDNAVRINGHLLRFPLSYDELKAELGEAKVCFNDRFRDTDYVYDELGIIFNGSPAYLNDLKKKKAFIDNEHTIIALTLYVTGNQVYGFKDTKPEKQYGGTLTFFGRNIVQEKMWRSVGGYGYQPEFVNDEGKTVLCHVSASLYFNDEVSVYDGDRITRDANITFKPERPKSSENFNIVIPDEECLVFDTFNFKLAVINELMYNQLVLKPYFDIYDYMAFKKAHWNLETDKTSKLPSATSKNCLFRQDLLILLRRSRWMDLTKSIRRLLRSGMAGMADSIFTNSQKGRSASSGT